MVHKQMSTKGYYVKDKREGPKRQEKNIHKRNEWRK